MSARFSICIHGLRRAFGQRVVLDVDGLEMESDCTYALVGPNGSGKSTLLRVLGGSIDQTDGYVEASGSISRDELAVGYMPQRSHVFGFSVYRNVALAIASKRLPKHEVERRVMGALEAVGMEAFAHVRGSGLSGGEAQRVALARMLVQELDVLLLDEPTASMDIAGTLLVEEALVAYRKRTGCLLVVATHVPSQARRMTDRVVMLNAGRVVESGPTDDVLTHPQSPEGQLFLSYWNV